MPASATSAGIEEQALARDRPVAQVPPEKLGFVPNVFLAYQWRPSRLAAWMNHFDAVMEPTDSLPAAEREMIAVAVSMANACSYCLVAHGYSVRKLTRDPVNGDLITLDYKRAEITPRQRAMLDYARVLTVSPAELEEADLESLREHGLSDEDIWDVIEVASMFNFTNRMAHATGMLPNPSTTRWRAEPPPQVAVGGLNAKCAVLGLLSRWLRDFVCTP
jgi:uncharacterized peroxidase-related enzyme